MRIIEETQLDFDDLLISPKRSTLNSRSEVELSRTFEWKDINGNKQSLTCIPIIVANMATIGTPRIAKIVSKHGLMCALEKHYPFEALDELYTDLENIALAEGLSKNFYSQKVMPSIGVKEDVDIIKHLNDKHPLKCICIDVPNGYIPRFIDRINEIAKICPQAMLICGNVVTGDICQDIILHGHGIVAKTGIGQGSACITRSKTGVGRPQASTIIECADACHQVGGFCCSDGGCKTVGDIGKAFGCGADFVMLGGMFAGCEEAEGETVYIDNKPHKLFYGMSSNLAQERHFGGRRASSTSEGREKYIPITGSIEDVIKDIKGGLNSLMTYIGARKLKDIPKCCTFFKVNSQLNLKFANCKDFKNN